LAATAAVVVVAAAVAACEPGTVTLTFRPAAGQELDYDSDVRTSSTTDLPDCDGGTPRTRSERSRQHAHQTVLSAGDDGVVVRVELGGQLGTRTFTVRFDRAAQLTSIEEVEGIPSEALGPLGLSEIFPAAAGAPPDEPLAPGDRWTIDDEVVLPGETEPTRLRGDGHLVELGVEDGHDVATIETSTVLPVRTTTADANGTRTLDGEQRTEVTATYDLADGALRRARAVTTHDFTLTLGPPAGGAGAPCTGTLDVVVRSEIRRAG
jgi:hypothetical protein